MVDQQHRPSVYIETSIPSFYFETRRSPTVVSWREATRRWWDVHRSQYSLCTSALVHNELARAPAAKAQRAMGLLDGVPLLGPLPAMADVVQFYVEHRLMPAGAEGDAGHLALASMHGMQFLLTWNCRHLANANKTQHLAVLNARLGLHTPIITTPLSLVPEDAP